MNPIFRILLQQAKKMITNPAKTKKTLERAAKKSGKIADGESTGLLSQLREDLALFFSMLGDFVRGRYKDIPIKSVVKILAALLYFVLIVDLVPDFLAIIGLTDDAAVLAWVIKSIGGDIDKYRAWIEQKEDTSIEDVPFTEG